MQDTEYLDIKDVLLAMGQRCVSLPDVDVCSVDDILRYDCHGLPAKDK